MGGVRRPWRKSREEQREWLVGGVERAGLQSLQCVDTANEQVVFPAYGAPDGERDNVIGALKLLTNLIKR